MEPAAWRALPLVVPLVVALVLGFTPAAQAWDQLDYCQGKTCPRFTRTATQQSYEARLYEASVWMCTEVSGTSVGDVTSACDRLKGFIEQKKQDGVDMDDNTWPGLIRQHQGQDGPKYEMCWMVSPDVTLPHSDDGPVKVKVFPQATFFVRTFGGAPSLEGGQENANTLKEDLTAARESFDSSVFCAAGYESYFSLTHHNEIWIPKV